MAPNAAEPPNVNRCCVGFVWATADASGADDECARNGLLAKLPLPPPLPLPLLPLLLFVLKKLNPAAGGGADAAASLSEASANGEL